MRRACTAFRSAHSTPAPRVQARMRRLARDDREQTLLTSWTFRVGRHGRPHRWPVTQCRPPWSVLMIGPAPHATLQRLMVGETRNAIDRIRTQ